MVLRESGGLQVGSQDPGRSHQIRILGLLCDAFDQRKGSFELSLTGNVCRRVLRADHPSSALGLPNQTRPRCVIRVFVRQWAVCRGAVGQLVDCHGLHYALLPSLYVRGLGRNLNGVPHVSRSDVMPNVLYTSELYLYQDTRGWHYKALEPIDFYTQPGSSFESRIADRHAYGPFVTSEEAVRDAVTQLGLQPGWYAGFSELAAQYAPGTELHRAAMVLEKLPDADVDAPALPSER